MNSITDKRNAVTGRAGYAEKLLHSDCLVARVLHSKIANGFVTSIDADKAKRMAGVIKVISCFDITNGLFSLTDNNSEVGREHKRPDSMLLSSRVRYFGEPILVVVATDSLTAERALSLIKVEYSQNEPIFGNSNNDDKIDSELHEGVSGNLYGRYESVVGEHIEMEAESYTGKFSITPTYAGRTDGCLCYIKEDKLYIHSSADGYCLRSTVAASLNMPMSAIKVIGGGTAPIGYEPLCAYITSQLAGRAVKIEKCHKSFSLRAAMKLTLQSSVTESGSILNRGAHIVANVGAYAKNTHGAAIAASRLMRMLYSAQGSYSSRVESYYSNLPPTTAMQGYGYSHALFAIESHIDDIAFDRGIDPMLLRIKNCIRSDYIDSLEGYAASSYELDSCIIRGRELIDWDNRRKELATQIGDNRKGIGMAIFCYNDSSVNVACSVKLNLSPDGSLVISGSVPKNETTKNRFLKTTAAHLGIQPQMISYDEQSDLLPNGSEFATGFALKETTLRLKLMLIEHAQNHMSCEVGQPDIKEGYLVEAVTGHRLLPVYDIAQDMYDHGILPSVEAYCDLPDRTLSFGATFAEVTVNIPMCKVEVTKVLSILDNGYVSDSEAMTKDATAMMSEAIAFTLGEEATFNAKTGKPCYDVEYKKYIGQEERMLEFIDSSEPKSAYGNKTLGDAAFVSVAPAIRNAILNATGIKLNTLPITSEHLFVEFEQAGII